MGFGHEADDGTLVRRAQEGDEDAFRVLFERHSNGLRQRVLGRLAPAIRRKVSFVDVLQEAYLVAVRRIGDFEDRGKGSFGNWLRRIVDMRTMKIVEQFAGTEKRNPFREVTRGERQETGQFIGDQPTPSQVAIGAECGAAARDALGDLPEDYRTVLRLLQEDDLTFEEAAERMGRTLAATRKLYGRALARLAKGIAERQGEGS